MASTSKSRTNTRSTTASVSERTLVGRKPKAKSKTRSTKAARPKAKRNARQRRGAVVLAKRDAETSYTGVFTRRLRRRALGRELAALALLAGGALLALALLSYNPLDSQVGQWGGDPEPVRNWAGAVGAAMAELLVQAVGMAAWLAPPSAVVVALLFFSRLRRRLRAGEVIGLLGLGLCIPLVLHLSFDEFAFRGGTLSGGGVVGGWLSSFLLARLSTAGTWILAVTGSVASVRLAFGVRSVDMVTGLWSLLRGGGRPVVGWVRRGAAAVAHFFWNRALDLRDGVEDRWYERREERALAREAKALEREARAQEIEALRAEQEQQGFDDELAGGAEQSEVREAAVEVDSARMAEVIYESTHAAHAPQPEAPAVIAPAPDRADEVGTDSMRGAAERGVVHVELRPGASSRRQAAAPPKTLSTDRGAAADPRPQVGVRIAQVAAREAVEGVDRLREVSGFLKDSKPFDLPELSLLTLPPAEDREVDTEALQAQAKRLKETLGHFNVAGDVAEILPGPVVTQFEFKPAPGIKVSKIAGLSDDLAMSLEAMKVRIVAPIPGKGAVGIEVPSPKREMIYLRETLASRAFRDNKMQLPLALGKAIDGSSVVADMAKMPHLLVAGTTGSGKSVAVNGIILSLLYTRTPEEVRLILVDPKMLEFSMYEDIPHLLVPVVTSPKKAAVALNWTVMEMERRYTVLSSANARNIVNYNEKVEQLTHEWTAWDASCKAGKPIDKPDCGRAPGEDTVCFRSEGGEPAGPPEKMPYIVVVIDEFADLMMVAKKEVEESVVRLAQKARACGIHLLLATQRPSVDVITGLIKANLPTRLSFRVGSKIDSRTVLDRNGAEDLLGLGDGLFLPPGSSDLKRVHGAFVSDGEVEAVVRVLKAQREPEYVNQVLEDPDEAGQEMDEEEFDSRYDEAVAVVCREGKASTSLLQRHLKLGYNRAARIIDCMERQGVIGPPDGARPREVLARGDYD